MNLIRLLIVVLVFSPVFIFGAIVDDSLTLFMNLNKADAPSEKVAANIGLAEFYFEKDINKSLYYAKEALKLALLLNDHNLTGKTYRVLGEVHFLSGSYDDALADFDNSYKESEAGNNVIGIGEAYAGLGKTIYKKGDNDLALKKFREALNIFEKEQYKNALPGLYINIGLLFDDARNFDQAIDFYKKALEIAKDIDDYNSEASCYTNLGSIYVEQRKYDKAIAALEKSIEIKKKTGNKKGIAVSLNNLGAAYYEMNKKDKALICFEQANQIYNEINDPKGIFPSCSNVGSIYLDEKKYSRSIPYFNRAFQIAKQLNSVSKQIICLENLTEAHKGLGNYAEALDFSIECWRLKDTLYNRDQAEITAEMQTKFASEKKQQENEILNLRVKSESFLKTVFIVAACLLLVIAFYIFRGLRQKQKINLALNEKNKIIEEQKQTVENQKQVVEEQNKDITDSIKYAKRIQQAILPPDKIWSEILPQSFVFYKPKDILSGDFYWIEKMQDLILVAAADCTGHGVPGALISIVNYNLLNKAVLEKELTDPAKILDYVNSQLIEALHQTYQESSVKDGMDISLCVINTKTLELNFAGANNPIYIIRDQELIQLQADKFPVGAFIEEKVQNFSNKFLKLKKNDFIYLFSDGFADQFGGPKGKKFKYKQLQALLLTLTNEPMETQKRKLCEAFETWKGNLEQIDDVCLIGIKI